MVQKKNIPFQLDYLPYITGLASGSKLGCVLGTRIVEKMKKIKIPRRILRIFISNNKSDHRWLEFYRNNKGLLTKIFGNKDNFRWMINMNFNNFMEKIEFMKTEPSYLKKNNFSI